MNRSSISNMSAKLARLNKIAVTGSQPVSVVPARGALVAAGVTREALIDAFREQPLFRIAEEELSHATGGERVPAFIAINRILTRDPSRTRSLEELCAYLFAECFWRATSDLDLRQRFISILVNMHDKVPNRAYGQGDDMMSMLIDLCADCGVETVVGDELVLPRLIIIGIFEAALRSITYPLPAGV
ncbi:hypothetical protein H9P43_008247 [Blastocladiella emersonii ATCC 22665]|nr:hypothetical protein H9P43_008247 [Blastocladiella emersonii ATCC 22665]